MEKQLHFVIYCGSKNQAYMFIAISKIVKKTVVQRSSAVVDQGESAWQPQESGSSNDTLRLVIISHYKKYKRGIELSSIVNLFLIPNQNNFHSHKNAICIYIYHADTIILQNDSY